MIIIKEQKKFSQLYTLDRILPYLNLMAEGKNGWDDSAFAVLKRKQNGKIGRY